MVQAHTVIRECCYLQLIVMNPVFCYQSLYFSFAFQPIYSSPKQCRALFYLMVNDTITSLPEWRSEEKMENEFLLIPHHVAINVSDIDAAVEWYCDKLDFTVEKRDFIKGFRGKNALLKHGEFRIEIFQNERVIPRPVEDIPPPGTEVLGFRQLAFSVSDPQKFTEILESREVEITMKRPDGTVLFIRDNSGNVIEFTSQVTG